MQSVDFSEPWQDLLKRIMSGQDRLYSIQQDGYSEWRARKLLGLRDSEATFYAVEQNWLSPTLDHAAAWRSFTDELVTLYVEAHRREDEPYGLGLALALEYQRGFAPEIDAAPLPQLVKPHGVLL